MITPVGGQFEELGTFMIPDQIRIGIFQIPHTPDCPEPPVKAVVIQAIEEDHRHAIALDSPQSVAEHIVGLLAVANGLFGVVGMRANLDRSIAEYNARAGETVVKL